MPCVRRQRRRNKRSPSPRRRLFNFLDFSPRSDSISRNLTLTMTTNQPKTSSEEAMAQPNFAELMISDQAGFSRAHALVRDVRIGSSLLSPPLLLLCTTADNTSEPLWRHRVREISLFPRDFAGTQCSLGRSPQRRAGGSNETEEGYGLHEAGRAAEGLSGPVAEG